jgi:hypothetical protein
MTLVVWSNIITLYGRAKAPAVGCPGLPFPVPSACPSTRPWAASPEFTGRLTIDLFI